jgi:cytochrome b subunit of formate dehydrogenase
MNPAGATGTVFVRRFDRIDRTLHALLMISFLGLAATGLPLLFSQSGWASTFAHALGGFEAAGTIHRVFAATLIAVFFTHLARLFKRLILQRERGILWGPTSLVPQPRDVEDIIGHVNWFLGRGPRPRFERYTYWEKFDYWAVFWGMAIIGGSGLMLWFPLFFARVVPGWLFNIALLIHGEEALLAVGFIFTIHFFNGHLRPEKFPMDMVIFTGRTTVDELQRERPGEYARVAASGELERIVVSAPDEQVHSAGRALGTFAVTTGVVLLSLIVYALAVR